MNNAGPGPLPETGDDHEERTLMTTAETITTVTVDPECVLRDVASHQCYSRDWVERSAAGQPALRPGAACYGGARHQLQVERDARVAAVGLAKKVRTLLDVLHEYGYTHGDAECEIADATDACFMFELAGSVAGWHKGAS